jgi:hypothetical protein
MLTSHLSPGEQLIWLRLATQKLRDLQQTPEGNRARSRSLRLSKRPAKKVTDTSADHATI